MGKVKGKHRLDKYYRLAKEHGYRSRASYKLIQLDSKFSFLHKSRGVLDLCAAPGGWMQVAVNKVPVGSLVLGIDLVPIAPIRGAVAIEQDITRSECKAKIKKVMSERGCVAFDLVLHDGSPNVGGAWSQEAMSQNALVIDSVRLATQFLAPKGTFVTKVFRSQDYSSVLYCLKQLFEKVEVDKPSASRSASAEIYVVGLKYKAPAKIDPRLLDVKYLFQGSIEPQRKVVDVLRGSKQKRHRDGYEDGDTTLRKVSSATDFIWSDNPLEILGSVTAITFKDPACLPIKENPLTTEEVTALCDDLGVLGKQDFKHLLKWRMQIRKDLSPSQKAEPAAAKDTVKEDEVDEDDKVLNEMEELSYAMERKKKREKKIIAKRRAKDKVRKATLTQVDATEDSYVDLDLFSLKTIKGKDDQIAVDAVDSDDENADLRDSDDEENREGMQDSDSDVDSDEERRRYDEKVEHILDEAYEHYVSRKEGSTMQRKRVKQSYEESENLEGGDVMVPEYDSDKDLGVQEANPLVVPLNDGDAATQEEITNKWFSQDIFAEAVEDGDLDKDESEDEMEVDIKEENIAVPRKPQEKKTEEPKPTKEKKKANIAAEVRAPPKGEDTFEIVPAPETDSSDDDSSSDESEDEDAYTKAEILACAKKMLGKKQREQLLDDAYNRYMYDDDGGLPKWFIDEEKKHRVMNKPVTKAEINAMKAQFKEIDARPAKKVAQAKARKKRVVERKLEKVRKKANTISDLADISDKSKTKMIDQLYKKAAPKRPKKEYVVAKKGVQVRVGKGKVLVDPRMKKDARAARGKAKGKDKGKGGKGKGKDSKGGKGSAKGGAKGNKGGGGGGARGKKMGRNE